MDTAQVVAKRTKKRLLSTTPRKAKKKRLSGIITSNLSSHGGLSKKKKKKSITSIVPTVLTTEWGSTQISKHGLDCNVESTRDPASPLGPDIPITQMIKPVSATLSRVKLFNPRHSQCAVLVLVSGEYVKLWGAFRLMSIVGEAEIDSYILRPAAYDEDRLIPVCAPFRVGKPSILVGNCLGEEENQLESRVALRLTQVTSEVDKIMKLYRENPKGISIIVIDKRMSPIQNIIESIQDNIFTPPLCSKSGYGGNFFCASADDFYFYSKNSSLQIMQLMNIVKSKRAEGEKLCIVTVGAKGTGKSSIMRRMVNDLISSEVDAPPVYVMDVDIGQCEFAPVACMSLVKVEKPLTDLPFCHQPAYFKHSYLFGNVTPDYDIQRYNDIVSNLYKHWKQTAEPGSVLVVNTMGYIEGIGAQALNHIFNVTSPIAAVYMNPAPFKGVFTPGYKPQKYIVPPYVARVIRIDRYLWDNSAFGGVAPSRSLNAAALRNLSLLGYLAKALPNTRQVLSAFVEIVPYKVSFSAITISIPEDLGNIEEEGVLASINCTLLGLGYWEQEQKCYRLFNNPLMPSVRHTTAGDLALKMIGFGIIRAIDLEKRLFYVITPIPPIHLEQVTVFEKIQNVHMPQEILSSQPVDEVPYIVRGSKRGNNIQQDMYKGLRNTTGQKRTRGAK